MVTIGKTCSIERAYAIVHDMVSDDEVIESIVSKLDLVNVGGLKGRSQKTEKRVNANASEKLDQGE